MYAVAQSRLNIDSVGIPAQKSVLAYVLFRHWRIFVGILGGALLFSAAPVNAQIYTADISTEVIGATPEQIRLNYPGVIARNLAGLSVTDPRAVAHNKMELSREIGPAPIGKLVFDEFVTAEIAHGDMRKGAWEGLVYLFKNAPGWVASTQLAAIALNYACAFMVPEATNAFGCITPPPYCTTDGMEACVPPLCTGTNEGMCINWPTTLSTGIDDWGDMGGDVSDLTLEVQSDPGITVSSMDGGDWGVMVGGRKRVD